MLIKCIQSCIFNIFKKLSFHSLFPIWCFNHFKVMNAMAAYNAKYITPPKTNASFGLPRSALFPQASSCIVSALNIDSWVDFKATFRLSFTKIHETPWESLNEKTCFLYKRKFFMSLWTWPFRNVGIPIIQLHLALLVDKLWLRQA